MPIQRYKSQPHPYHNYHHRRFVESRRRWWPWLLLVLPPLIILMVGGFLYARPLPLVAPEKQVLALTHKTQPKIDWPVGSQVTFGTTEQGILASKPNQQIRPTASTIKLLTVLTVLDQKPLKSGEQGPLVPITRADIDIYNNYYRQNGSLAEIAIGEQISQYQMFEGILISSANNYADTLAIWAFGSLEKYQAAAQAMASKLGMRQTTVGVDASGFSPTSTSTADDLTILGIAAMKQPIIAEIVAKPEVTLPVAGLKRNTNWSLSQNGVIGIKTGNTNEAGGVFIFAAKNEIKDSPGVTIVGAVQGERNVYDAILQARFLISQIKPQFQLLTPIKKNQPIATYTSPWGASAKVVAASDISFIHWPSSQIKPVVDLEPITDKTLAGSKVGTLQVGSQSVPVNLKNQLSSPSWQWRILNYVK